MDTVRGHLHGKIVDRLGRAFGRGLSENAAVPMGHGNNDVGNWGTGMSD